MAIFCLPKNLVSKMKNAIKDGTLHPDKLTKITSSQRRDMFTKIVGEENAKEMNMAFEKKLLLVNQERAMYDWAKDTLGLSKAQKEVTATKIRETYAEKRRRTFTPDEDEAFLNELTSHVYSKRYKTDISLDEAQKITELATDMSKAHEKMNDDFTWGNGSEVDRLNYGIDFGAKKVMMDKYVGDLKLEATQRKFVNPLKAVGFEGKVDAVREDLIGGAVFVANNSRAVQGSLDNSFWGRQGFKAMTSIKYTGIWAKNFAKSFTDLQKVLTAGKGKHVEAGQAVIDALKADIYSRPNFLNGRYEMGTKLAVGIREEAFPTSAPEMIPALGRFFKASETAYEAGALRMRVDMADKLYKIAEKQGIDMSDKFEVGSMNIIINSLTGRGELPGGEQWQAAVNATFFSVKKMKSDADFLFAHGAFWGNKGISKFARRQAAGNLLSSVASVGVVLGIANALWPDAVEWDPRSSDFGSIKIGNTRFDVTGGVKSFVTLLARATTLKTKSTTTGIVSEIGEGFGAGTEMDLFSRFLTNKFSPAANLLKNLWTEKDFMGEPLSRAQAAINAFTPISVQNASELMNDPESAPIIVAMLADAFGIGTSTYGVRRNEAEKLFDEIRELEGTEQAERVAELKENNPDMYKKVQKAEKDFAQGVTPLDKAIKMMGVQSGERSLFIYKEIEKFDNAADKNAYIDELAQKRILILDRTKKGKKTGSGWDILKQIEEIRDAGGTKPYLKRKAAEAKDAEDVGNILVLYAKAFRYDPESALVGIFTREKIEKIKGNTVIFKREVLSSKAVVAYKKAQGDDPSLVELDHIIDRQLGGRMLREKNFQNLLPVDHKAKTKVGNYLRGKLWTFQITEKQAQKSIQEYTDGIKTFEEIRNQFD